MILPDLTANPAEVAGCHTKHGGQVLQGDLLQKVRLFFQHFRVSLLAAEYDQIVAAGIDAADGVLQKGDVEILETRQFVNEPLEVCPTYQTDFTVCPRADVFKGWILG